MKDWKPPNANKKKKADHIDQLKAAHAMAEDLEMLVRDSGDAGRI
jgi:hypothetical protein